MEEGDSQPIIKAEPAEEQENIGDSANVSQEKSASSGSEGSDGFVKLDELEDAQTASPEAVEDLPTQTEAPASPEEFSKLTPSTDDVSKSSLEPEEVKMTEEQTIETPQATESGLQEAAEADVAEAVGGDLVADPAVVDTPTTLNSVEDVEKPAAPESTPVTTDSPKEESVEPCKLYTVLPTSVKRASDLLYWRDVKASAVTFGLAMLILLTLHQSSALLVFSYTSLSLLTVTVTVKMYRFIMQTVNGTQQPNPFQDLMDLDITISNEKAQKYLETFLAKFNCTMNCARDLFLIQNVANSVKFGLFCWFMGYVGSITNILTLVTIGVAGAFTLPAVYEKNKAQIDQYYGMAQEKITQVCDTVRRSIPFLKPKVE